VEDQLFQGKWSQEEQSLHINVLEMRAVVNTLKAFLPPRHTTILVASDSSTVVAYINREGGTHSFQLMDETLSLYQLAMEHAWILKARHIPGKLNVIADQLSRQGIAIPTEWSLKESVVESLFLRWHKPLIDLFATRHNKKCQLFVSPVPDPLAIAVDALSLDYEGLDAYAFPPHQILGKVLQRFQAASNCSLILVAPLWPKQPWYPLLTQLMSEEPVPLPPLRDLLRQPLTGSLHSDPEVLQLHAWKLVRRT